MMTADEDLLNDIDFSFLVDGERRIDEVAIATKFKGSELMNLFNQAHLAAQKARSTLYARVQALEVTCDALAATIALEKAPAYLKERGLVSARSPGGSEDQRQAVVNSDPDYIAMRKRILNLKAGVEEYSIRARSMERCFSAVKCIFLDHTLPNPTLNNAPAPRSSPEGQKTDSPPQSQHKGFGAARYT